MRLLARRITIAGGAIVLVGVFAAVGLYFALRQVPSYYRQALAGNSEQRREQAQAFERQALNLNNNLQHAGRWEVRFTDDEINAWLADLPKNFPKGLPPNISQPRLSIEAGRLRLAFAYDRGDISTVLSV